MHIAIDAHMVGERETGNETYTLNLIRGLLRVAGRDPKGFSWDAGESPGASDGLRRAEARRWGATPRFSLLTPHPERLHAALPELGDFPHAAVVKLRPANALLRIPFGLPAAALRRSVDLLHVTYNAPPVASCPVVVTIHDISFELYPEFFSPRDYAVLKTLVPFSARRAARVITVSQHAKREIVQRYGIDPAKVVVTYEAAAGQFQPVSDPAALQAVRDKYGIGDGPFLLALGNLQPRKNIARLVEAFRQAVSDERLTANSGRPTSHGEQRATTPDYRSLVTDHSTALRDGTPWSLVIAGKAQWRESEIFTTVQRASLEDRVVFPGYVDDADLPALYSAATAFVYPSLYEGFGLPPLEAMACGTPVVCSSAASLPEVVGDAAVSIDPLRVDSLAQGLSDVLGNAGLRDDLRARGLRRAARFSWDRCAAETLAVYAAAQPARLKP
ncbi:MAG: glycosyltransferase family 1 protein [Caldilineales bacterium]